MAARRGVPLAPYRRPGFVERHRFLCLTILALAALGYGAFFALTAPYFIVQMTLPLALPVMLAIWALPDDGKPYERTVSFLFWAYMLSLMVWPDYLAFQFPGLPWITFARLFALPLALVYLISLSQSHAYRAETYDALKTTGPAWKFLLAFAILALISIAFSNKTNESLNKYIIAVYAWFSIFFVSFHIFLKRGRPTTFVVLIWGSAALACFFGIWEARISQVPWASHIPSFLQVEDPIVQQILAPKSRAATGIYRVQGKFTTPLGLSEFLALCAPFILHVTVTTRNIWLKLLGLVLGGTMIYIVVKTDSRLGSVGLLATGILYSLYFAVRRWQRDRDSLVSPLVILAYPTMVTLFIISSFFVRRIRNMVWGNGAYSASTEGRLIQIEQGMPMILNRPWGHGIGRAAETLGISNGEGVITIDTYYLSVALEVGIIGFIVYYAVFISGITTGIKALLRNGSEPEGELLAPAVITTINFVLIKSVFSQQENHPLFFAVLGMVLALSWRIQRHFVGNNHLVSTPRRLEPRAGMSATT